MSKKKKEMKVDLDLNSLAKDSGLVLLRDSDYALVYDRLPLFLPHIDRVLGGGFPFGRLIEIAGKSGGGKTTLTLHAARVATRLGCIVVLIDVEGTSDRERLDHLGVDVDRVLVKQPDPDKGINLTVEEIGRTIEQTLKIFKEKYPDTPVVYIWDSVGQTPSEVEMSKDYGDQNVGAKAKAITQFVTKITPVFAETKSLLLAINQVRDDIGGNPMYPTIKVPGGKAWEHAATLRLEVKKKQAIKKGQDIIGHTMGVKVNKSKVSRPFQEVNGYLISEDGIDYEYNLAKAAEEAGVLGGTSQSYEYVDSNGEIHKKRKDAFIDWMKTEEGEEVRKDILIKLIEAEFPDGYPALSNSTLDISGWIDNITNSKEATPKEDDKKDKK